MTDISDYINCKPEWYIYLTALFMPAKQHFQTGKNPNFQIVIIGASAGGFNALVEVIKHLPERCNAAVFIVVHFLGKSDMSIPVKHLQQFTRLKTEVVSDNSIIESGKIYFAIPDLHLIFKKHNRVMLGNGPKENGFRPSIDIAMRSAAVEYRERVTGIILSGMLDDGVTGMLVIRECGGLCITQDPLEAEYPDMPLAVMNKMKPDYTLRADEIGKMIVKTAKRKVKKKIKIPTKLIEEVELAQKVLTGIDNTRSLGLQSLFTCPDCGGSLWKLNENGVKRYRCFTGHVFSEQNLLTKQNEQIQTTLWIALRQLEERKKLSEKHHRAFNYSTKETEALSIHIDRLKTLLADLQKLNVNEKINNVGKN
jgi:two-component system chemotaxis response regulator CheB